MKLCEILDHKRLDKVTRRDFNPLLKKIAAILCSYANESIKEGKNDQGTKIIDVILGAGIAFGLGASAYQLIITAPDAAKACIQIVKDHPQEARDLLPMAERLAKKIEVYKEQGKWYSPTEAWKDMDKLRCSIRPNIFNAWFNQPRKSPELGVEDMPNADVPHPAFQDKKK